jgi:hypothetical protein
MAILHPAAIGIADFNGQNATATRAMSMILTTPRTEAMAMGDHPSVTKSSALSISSFAEPSASTKTMNKLCEISQCTTPDRATRGREYRNGSCSQYVLLCWPCGADDTRKPFDFIAKLLHSVASAMAVKRPLYMKYSNETIT